MVNDRIARRSSGKKSSLSHTATGLCAGIVGARIIVFYFTIGRRLKKREATKKG
jgi:hypothetical protein